MVESEQGVEGAWPRDLGLEKAFTMRRFNLSGDAPQAHPDSRGGVAVSHPGETLYPTSTDFPIRISTSLAVARLGTHSIHR